MGERSGRIERIEPERIDDLARRIFRRELLRIEQRCLYIVVEARNLPQDLLGRMLIDEIATGEHDERAQARAARKEFAPHRIGHFLRRIFDEQAFVDAGNDGFALHGVTSRGSWL